MQDGERAREVMESGGKIVEESQNDEKDAGKNGENAAIVRYARYDETH